MKWKCEYCCIRLTMFTNNYKCNGNVKKYKAAKKEEKKHSRKHKMHRKKDKKKKKLNKSVSIICIFYITLARCLLGDF